MIRIGGRAIGPGKPAYLVAELSGNHNGSIERALSCVRAAAEAGADAIKLQTYRPDTLTIQSGRPDFIVPEGSPWSGRTLFELYEEAHTPWDWHPCLFEESRKLGLEIFSTPFDETAVDLLEDLGAPAYKIASFELVDDGLLRAVARTGKPVVASTGMASLEEVMHAVDVLRQAGANDILLLRCTSSYPAPDSAMNLRSIPALAEETGCPVGLSDHSLGTLAPVIAVSLGACFIEKHFTLSRADGGVDSAFSLDPVEFSILVQDVRRAESMLGTVTFGAGEAEGGSRAFRRSLYVVEDMAQGDIFSPANLRSIRPGYGLAPKHLEDLIGRPAACDIPRGTAMSWELASSAEDPNGGR